MKELQQEIQVLEKQLLEVREKATKKSNDLYKSQQEVRIELVNRYLSELDLELNLSYQVLVKNNNFVLWNKDFDCKIEIELDKDYNFKDDSYYWTPRIKQNSWFNGFSEFKPFENNKKVSGQFFFMQDYLTVTEKISCSNFFDEFQSILQLQVSESKIELDEVYNLINTLEKIIKEKKNKLTDYLLENCKEVILKEEFRNNRWLTKGILITKRTPKKIVYNEYCFANEQKKIMYYEKSMKKEELVNYLQDSKYEVIC